MTAHAKVLLVEDDVDVRDSTADLLTTFGFEVVTAHEAREALSILDRDAAIAVLLSDIAMPGGMNGAQLAVEARRTHPDLKVLLASGYRSWLRPGFHAARRDALQDTLSKIYTLTCEC